MSGFQIIAAGIRTLLMLPYSDSFQAKLVSFHSCIQLTLCMRIKSRIYIAYADRAVKQLRKQLVLNSLIILNAVSSVQCHCPLLHWSVLLLFPKLFNSSICLTDYVLLFMPIPVHTCPFFGIIKLIVCKVEPQLDPRILNVVTVMSTKSVHGIMKYYKIIY